MQKLPKLVRDHIPELIKERGALPETEVLDQNALYSWLLTKLREEISEFEESPCVEELVDLYEVILALASTLNIPFEVLEHERKRKNEERGGFNKGILLLNIKET